MQIREKLANAVADTAAYKQAGYELLPHQERAINALENSEHGILAYHGLGSGKTLTAIAAADKLNLPITAIVPAALRENFKKELIKHLGSVPDSAKILSYNQAVANPEIISDDSLVVIDEAHNLGRTDSQRSQLLKQLQEYNNKILLSATPIRNDPSEIAPLINAISGRDVMPLAKKDFYKKFMREDIIDPGIMAHIMGVRPGVDYSINTNSGIKELLGDVNFHPSQSENFPVIEDKTIQVPMSAQQQKIYDFVTDQMPYSLKYKMQRNLPPSKSESSNLNSFLNAARQVSNNPMTYDESGETALADASKLISAVNALVEHKAQKKKALIYSNYLESGVLPYAELLKDRGVTYDILTGSVPFKARHNMVNRYNADELDALLVTSAGGEGLDLKGTEVVQILEPHWNEEKLNQLIGRAARYKSHEHLPEDRRKVLVERYITTNPELTGLGALISNKATSSDEYLSNLSQKKQELNNQLLDLLKREA